MSASIRRRRWIAKKLARHGMALGATALGSSGGVRVLTYHRFGDSIRDPFCVRTEDFEAQMLWLADRRLAVTVEQVERFVEGEGTLPEGAVLVTIDDGCRSVHTQALPILRAHAIPAVVYVPAGVVGSGAGGLGEDVMGWDELARLVESGVTVGSHSFEHRSLGQMSRDEAEEQLVRSKALLEERLGTAVTSFAYPYGTRADFDDSTARAVRAAGYRSAFTSQHGALAPGMDPACLPRVKVEGGDAGWMFPLVCAGALDSWRVVDQLLWRLQR